MSKLVHKGSTKDVYEDQGHYIFKFSDRYSVFDWGEMPDLLEGKGEALAHFTKTIYEKLAASGIKHHLLDLKTAANEIKVQPFQVVRDGSSLANKENVFIPLEVIFRMGYAKGSSLKKKMTSEKDWLDAGFSRSYSELEMFDKPMIEFTTKLERFDRPLTHHEAMELSGLTSEEWNGLLNMTTSIANKLKAIFEEAGLTLWDGKIELAAGNKIGANREIILVDSIGPDELRLTKNGIQLSKEIIRQYYRQTKWYQDLDTVKEKYGVDFKEFISAPPALPKEFKASVEEMYKILPLLIHESKTAELKFQRLLTQLRSFV